MTKFLLNDFIVRRHVESALIEDIGYGDISTDFISENKELEVYLSTRQDGIFCGKSPFKTVFEVLGNVNLEFFVEDGDKISQNKKLAKISGSARSVLTGERLALNYAQKMSGIATYTNKYVEKIKNYQAKIVDTRKNTPNFRIFEKYSVKIGGGSLHRFNLCDCVMLKDNHIALMGGSIQNAVDKIRENVSHAHKIEVECDTFKQVQQSLEAKVDIIMLDNMNQEEIEKCIKYIDKKAIVEISGNVTLDNIEKFAKTGCDIISSSAIVAKAPTLDLGFDYLN